MVREAKKKGLRAPVLFMGYYNPLLIYGEETIIKDAREAGVNGFIVVDLPPEEAVKFRNFCRRGGLVTPLRIYLSRLLIRSSLSYVPLIAPATSESRLKLLCKIADSFVYVVSRMGVTGATGTLNTALPELLERVHTYTGGIPAAVGFGVSTRDHFLSVASIAEGVVIGSQIITTLANAPAGHGAEAVREYCAEVSGRSGEQYVTTREVGIVETVNEARPPNGVTVDEVVKDRQNGSEPGLVDQIEALNANGDVDTAVCICYTRTLLDTDQVGYIITFWGVWRSIRSRVSHGLFGRA